MTESVCEPKDMAWIEKGVLGIEWNDGHKAVYPVRYLRQQCPCAACVDEWSGARRLQPDDVPLLIMLQDVQPVGRYALQFSWSDGHDYRYLLLFPSSTALSVRRVSACETC